jgi:hypothetical protein
MDIEKYIYLRNSSTEFNTLNLVFHLTACNVGPYTTLHCTCFKLKIEYHYILICLQLMA